MRKLNDQKMVTLIFKALMLAAFISMPLITYSQDKIIGKTISSANLRVSPSAKSASQGMLQTGTHVTILSTTASGWSRVSFTGQDSKGRKVNLTGYVKSTLLSKSVKEDMSKYPRVDDLYDTEERSSIGCENIYPRYDYDHDCSLVINAHSADYDTVLKLCRVSDGECVRMVYVRNGTSFTINNIPTGSYYLKLASGTDMRKKVDGYGNCMIVFVNNASYKKTRTTFNFHRVYNGSTSYSDVGYEFVLKARRREDSQSVKSSGISLEEFNR